MTQTVTFPLSTYVWRFLHPTSRDYSFFSPVHDSYCRIDLLFLQHYHLARVQQKCIKVMAISDHTPVSMDVGIMGILRAPFHWCLNESLLHKKQVTADVVEKLSLYFLENDEGDTDPLTICQAHKSFIRRMFIRHGSRLKRRRAKQIATLLSDIHALEVAHKRTLALSTLAELNAQRDQPKHLILHKSRAALAKCNWFFYEHNNKCGTALARSPQSRYIWPFLPEIQSKTGSWYISPIISLKSSKIITRLYTV